MMAAGQQPGVVEVQQTVGVKVLREAQEVAIITHTKSGEMVKIQLTAIDMAVFAFKLLKACLICNPEIAKMNLKARAEGMEVKVDGRPGASN